MSRQVFFSFEYKKDAWRVAQVRNMEVVDGCSTFSDNDWEQVQKDSDLSIERWINSEMEKRSCLVVLVGETTYTRKWVKYEIKHAYEKRKGIIGVRIDWLKDDNGNYCHQGLNPFDYVEANDGEKLSYYVKLYTPNASSSKEAYDDIKQKLPDLIENAIEKAGSY